MCWCANLGKGARINQPSSTDGYVYANTIYIISCNNKYGVFNTYDITSETFKNVLMPINASNEQYVKHKMAPYKESLYMVSAKHNQPYNYFNNYTVATNTWKNISFDTCSIHIPRFNMCAMGSTKNGVVLFGNSQDFVYYVPESNLWSVGKSEVLGNGFENDTLNNIKCMSQSRCGYGDDGVSYIYNDVSNCIFRFDSSSLTIQNVSSIMQKFCKGGTCK
jgi:hypothetical protein